MTHSGMALSLVREKFKGPVCMLLLISFGLSGLGLLLIDGGKW